MILVVATVLTAECKEFWQLLLCQGLLTGFACGMIFGPLPAIVSQWFKTRRSLAFGVIAAGSSLGGTIIPIAARHLVELIGYVGAQCMQRTWLIGFLQLQMDDANDCPDRTLHAHDSQLGKDFHVKPSRYWLNSVTSRLSGEGSILPKRPVHSSLGTISKNLHSTCTSLAVSSTSWVSSHVGSATFSLSSFCD